MVTTLHRFLDLFRFKPTDKFAIFGTIHPHVLEDFLMQFYYGNVGSMWKILQQAFPEWKINSASRESILAFLEANNIWVCDMIKECKRAHSGITKDEKLVDIVLNTEGIREGLLNSQIDTIFFTSRLGKNNAAKLFCDAFGIKINKLLNKETSEFIIPAEIFGRPIKGILLFSPSGAANVGISMSKAYKSVQDKYVEHNTPVAAFRVDFYREKFSVVTSRRDN